MIGKPKHIWRWIALAAIAACMAFIFLFSSQDTFKSNEMSGGMVEAFCSWAFGGLPEEELQNLNLILRKCTHFSIYAGMAVCMSLFFLTFSGSLRKKFGLVVLLAFLYASLDEWHQTFVPGRTGSIRDVLIDTCGAVLGASLVLLIAYFRRRKRRLLVQEKRLP